MMAKRPIFFTPIMKRILSCLSLVAMLASFAPISIVRADTLEVDRLEVTAAPTANIGEPIDLTVKALSKSGEVVTSYVGIVFVIVENDNKATVPYAEGYTFVAGDAGKKTFSKGLSFTKEGTFKVVVSDFDKAKIEGSAKVKVGPGSTSPVTTGKELVTITSPDDNSIMGNSTFSVVGTTKKSSRVQLFVNGAKALETQTDDKGSFVFDVKKVEQSKNIISVTVLDGANKVIGESAKVNVTVGSDGPQFNSIKLTQKDVAPGMKIGITVDATPGLKSVTISAADAAVTLKEGNIPGTYTGDLMAPAKTGSVAVDVTLKNELGKQTLKTAAETLNIQVPKMVYKNVKAENGDGKTSFSFEVENAPTTLAKFQFAYSSGSGAETKVLTSEVSKIKNITGQYVWFVPGLAIAKYAFVISAVDANGAGIPDTNSEVIDVDLSLASAGKCMINNVGGVKVVTDKDVSTLAWDDIAEAARYNVYKKNASGEFVFIESVPTNSYVIHIASGAVKYDDFAIKAVCSDSTESAKYSPSTTVQTGPGQMLMLAGLALLVGFGIFRRKLLK